MYGAYTSDIILVKQSRRPVFLSPAVAGSSMASLVFRPIAFISGAFISSA